MATFPAVFLQRASSSNQAGDTKFLPRFGSWLLLRSRVTHKVLLSSSNPPWMELKDMKIAVVRIGKYREKYPTEEKDETKKTAIESALKQIQNIGDENK